MRAYAERAQNGEANVLTAEPVLMFTMTSGSTGQPKLIPVTKTTRRTIASLQDSGIAALSWTIPIFLAANCSAS